MIHLKLALRNAQRNLRRTLLTAMTLLIGIALTTFTLSFLNGYIWGFLEGMADNHGHVRIVTEEFAEREQLQPLYANIENTAPLVELLSAQPGVSLVEPVIKTGVILAVGEEIGDDFGMLVGAESSLFVDHMHLDADVVEGTWLTGAKDEVVLGRKVALDIGAKVGEEILVMGSSQYGSMSPMSPMVVGIVSKNGLIDTQLYMPLEEARWMVDIPDGALSLLVYGQDYSVQTIDPLAARLDLLPELDGYSLESWSQDPLVAQTLPIINGINGGLSALMMFVMVLAIFNTMTMSVLERTGEIGVMRAMGQTRMGAVGLFLVEAISIGIIGGGAGVLIGGLGGYWMEVQGFDLGQDLVDQAGTFPIASVIHGDITPELLIQCFVLAVVTACLGALLPALRAASISPSAAMRSRR
jgi:putative ABC transport system permease protein